MNKINGLVLASVLVVAAALPALAVEPDEGVGNPPMHPQGGMENPPQYPQGTENQPTTHPQMRAAKPASMHTRATGKVTSIDHKRGLVSLRTSDGTFKLHYPADSIRDLKSGDKITAQLAFTKAELTEGATRAFDVPSGSGEHRMTGTVEKVDQKKGWIKVKSGDETLELRFPPQDVSDLKQGDRITVALAFTKD